MSACLLYQKKQDVRILKSLDTPRCLLRRKKKISLVTEAPIDETAPSRTTIFAHYPEGNTREGYRGSSINWNCTEFGGG